MSTDPRELFIERVDQVLDQCDASRLPPLIKLTREQAEALRQVDDRPHTWAPPGGLINPLYSVPVRFVDTVEESTPYQLLHGGPAFESPVTDAEPTEPACCDRHNQHCEVPFNTCCDTCPRAVELAELVAEHQQAGERERQALVEASPARPSRLVRITDTGPEPVIQIAQPKPASWWRRILGGQW